MRFPFFTKKKIPPHLRSGVFGERAARRYLRKNGYRIRARNHRDEGHEEIDIIAERRGIRAFVEVKTRKMSPDGDCPFGRPADAVTKEKQRHLASAARLYMNHHRTKKEIRMDVIEVYLDPASKEDRVLSVHHMKDAFRA